MTKNWVSTGFSLTVWEIWISAAEWTPLHTTLIAVRHPTALTNRSTHLLRWHANPSINNTGVVNATALRCCVSHPRQTAHTALRTSCAVIYEQCVADWKFQRAHVTLDADHSARRCPLLNARWYFLQISQVNGNDFWVSIPPILTKHSYSHSHFVLDHSHSHPIPSANSKSLVPNPFPR